MTYDFDWLRYNPLWSLSDALDVVWNNFPDAWEEYWGIGASYAPDHLEPDDWEMANQMHETAQRLSGAAVALSSRNLPERLRSLPGVLDQEKESERDAFRRMLQRLRESEDPETLEREEWQELERAVRSLRGAAEARRTIFYNAMELQISDHVRCDPAEFASRAVGLLEYVVAARGPLTVEYLQRVATCYMFDMAPELAVMARAVLEAALRQYNLDERLERNLRIQGKRHPSLVDWIAAAVDEGLLDQDARESAERIRTGGNDAIHTAPQQAPDTDETMRHLVEVLEQLEEQGRTHGE